MRLVFAEHPSFAELLREHRREARLSQQELAERSRLSLEAISALERGLRTRPRADTVRLLVRALNLDDDQASELMLARERTHRSTQQPSDDYRLLGRVTPMVGRATELKWACSRLRRPDTRLVALTGPPGVGKTRLAEAVLGKVRGDMRSVTAIDLTRVRVPELLVPVIATALGAPEGNRPGADGLIGYIGERRCLLLLDNFEHLLDAAPLIGELVVRCPQLRILVTSRSSLSLRDMQELCIEPLPLAQAVQMFVQRVRSRSLGFKVGATDRNRIERICLKLDCLPLALELAAPWLKLMTPKALLDRLGSPLDILVGGPMDLPERQRTMRAALDWSYALLEPDEQVLFKMLSVFSGGASLDAVEAVGQACGVAMPLTVLARLIDRGLAGTVDDHGEQRLSVLHTLREYGQHMLETSERNEVHRAHGEWYARLAADGASKLSGSEQGYWLERLESEHDNLRSALQWARERVDADYGVRLASSLPQFWNKHGHLREGRTWLEHFLSLQPDVPGGIRAMALRGAAGLSFRLNDVEAAKRYGEMSLSAYESAGDTIGMEAMLHNLAVFAWHEGDLDRALTMWEAQRVLVRGWRGTDATSREGRGDFDHGGTTFESRAIDVLEDLASMHRELGAEWASLRGLELIYLGTLGRAVVQADRARDWLNECLDLSQHLGWIGGTVGAQNRLADIARDSGDFSGAIAGYCASLRTVTRTRDVSTAGYCIEGLAACSALQDKSERAARLYAAAAAIRDAFGASQLQSHRREHDLMIAAVRSRLGEKRFRRAWSAGLELSFKEAETEALAADDPAVRRTSPRGRGALGS